MARTPNYGRVVGKKQDGCRSPENRRYFPGGKDDFLGDDFLRGFVVSHLDVGIFGTYPNWSQFGPCIGSFRRSRGTCWILPIFPVFRAGCNIVPLLFCRPWLCPFTHTGGGAFSENEPLRARREENFPNFPLDVFFFVVACFWLCITELAKFWDLPFFLLWLSYVHTSGASIRDWK